MCSMSVPMLFEEERFEIGFEEGNTWRRRRLGREFPVTGPMREKTRFPCLLSLMRGTVMRPSFAERRDQEG